jgi:uncharacterized protein (DUF1778 family)
MPRSAIKGAIERPLAKRPSLKSAVAARDTLGKTRTDFMLEAARRAAEDALLDRTLFSVNPEAYDQFLTRLDAPPQPNDRLRRTLAAKAPWDAP